MQAIWVCSTCKSINRKRDRQCYRCRAPQAAAMTAEGPDVRVEAAVMNRSARAYLPAWPVAALAGGLILAASLIGLVILAQQVAGYGALKAAFLDSIDNRLRGADPELLMASVDTALLSLLRAGLALLGLLTFAAWLAVATLNVPALGGGAPSRGPVRVFVYTLIPLWNLVKVPGMIQEVMYRIDPEAGGFGMVLAAWIGLVGSWLLSFVGGWIVTGAGVGRIVDAGTLAEASAAFASMLDQAFVLGVITEVMIAAGAIVLVLLMARIERRCALRDRAIRAAAT